MSGGGLVMLGVLCLREQFGAKGVVLVRASMVL